MGLQWSVGRKRYTNAELVRAASQVRNVSVSSHGPIVSLREGIGLRAWTAILNASDRNSNQLFKKAITEVIFEIEFDSHEIHLTWSKGPNGRPSSHITELID